MNNKLKEIKKVIVGQNELVDSLLIGLISSGHILVEGVPGLASSQTSIINAKVSKTISKTYTFSPKKDVTIPSFIKKIIYVFFFY